MAGQGAWSWPGLGVGGILGRLGELQVGAPEGNVDDFFWNFLATLPGLGGASAARGLSPCGWLPPARWMLSVERSRF